MRRKTPAPLIIRELTSKREWLAMYPLIHQLNKRMSRRQFEALLIEMLARGYRCVGAYRNKRLIAVMGFWIGYRFWCGKHIDVDNAVVDERCRGQGIGRRLLAWIEKEGKKQRCEIAGLDSYTTGHDSHRFYFRAGYSILGYHFTKDL